MAKYDVFISYSRKDTATADRICKALDKAGITYFIDRKGISGGEEFPKVLASAINESDIFLFLASQNSYQSIYTRTEVMYAFKKKHKDGLLLPYIIDNSQLPDDLDLVLSTTNMIRMREHPIESVLVPDLLRLLEREFTVNGVSFKMIYVEGGTFQMGSDDSDAYVEEKPVHMVTLSSYHIGETPVTQALWNTVMGNAQSWNKGNKQPVGGVSWYDCQEFIKKLNLLTGKTFRLPTEAEWEYAARGGKHHSPYMYAGSNNIDEVAWYYGNSGDKKHSVTTKKPNALGIYDMSGNVYEFCQDWYGDYSDFAHTDPKGPSDGFLHVLRGGTWHCQARSCRVYSRSHDYGLRFTENGFRLAL